MIARLFKVFIGSPTDTQNERDAVDGIFAQINETFGKERNFRIESFKWERNVVPDIGVTVQDVINEQGAGFDIFVGFMWQKYGSKGSKGMSPSEEEFDIAYESYSRGGKCKRIIYLFNNAPINPQDIDPVQLVLVREFQNKISQNGVVYKKYNGVEDFKNVLHVALYQAISEILSNDTITERKEGLRGRKPLDFDKNTKLLYDSLLLSPRVGKIKTTFIESYVQLYLYDHRDSTMKQICDFLVETFQHEDRKLYENVVASMKRKGMINGSKQFYLSNDSVAAIRTIVEQAEQSERSLLNDCDDICRKYNVSVDSTNLYTHITRLFDECYNVEEKSEDEDPVNKQQLQDRVTDQLVVYVANETRLPINLSTRIATEFVSVCCNNPTFDKCSTSKLFLNLFKQDKLEQYMSQTVRHLFLDTQVLLQLVCILYDNAASEDDSFYADGRLFWNSIKGNKLTRLYTTSCYVDEVVGNMVDALQLSSFLRMELQELFGDSKNVFLRDFLQLKKKGIVDTIDAYFSDMLGVDENDIVSADFSSIAYDVLVDYLNTIGIEVKDIPFFDNYEEYKNEYYKALYLVGYTKKDQTLTNDLSTILYMSEFAEAKRQTPYLVTRDNSFIKVRTKLLEKIKILSFWHIHSPLRVANMLSVMAFKPNPDVINRNIISIVEKSFDTYSSTDTFLDVMANYVDKENLSDWEFAKKMKKLKQSLEEKIVSEEQQSVRSQPSMEDYFNYLIRRYSKSDDDMKTLATVFSDNDYADRLYNAVRNTIEGFNVSGDNTAVNKQFDKLIRSYRYSHNKQDNP